MTNLIGSLRWAEEVGRGRAGKRVWTRAGPLGPSELHKPEANHLVHVEQGLGLVPWRRPVQVVILHAQNARIFSLMSKKEKRRRVRKRINVIAHGLRGYSAGNSPFRSYSRLSGRFHFE